MEYNAVEITDLTDKQFKALSARLERMGKTKLIERLEDEQINANLVGNLTKAARCEASIKWARKQPDWGN